MKPGSAGRGVTPARAPLSNAEFNQLQEDISILFGRSGNSPAVRATSAIPTPPPLAAGATVTVQDYNLLVSIIRQIVDQMTPPATARSQRLSS